MLDGGINGGEGCLDGGFGSPPTTAGEGEGCAGGCREVGRVVLEGRETGCLDGAGAGDGGFSG